MFNSLVQETLSNISHNTLALAIFSIITLFVIVLVLATVFPFWRRVLVGSYLLDENETPGSMLVWLISIIIIVKLAQTFIIQPFIVDGGSMIPTFHNKEFLLVDKISYRLGDPNRGDVAIFKLYEGANDQYGGKYLIKRIIGLPGERVSIKDGVTTIYNKENPEGFVLNESYVTYKDIYKNVDITLDEGHYFMMGDNRTQSYDSRDWGPLDEENLKGQVLFRLYPVSEIGYEPGRHVYTK